MVLLQHHGTKRKGSFQAPGPSSLALSLLSWSTRQLCLMSSVLKVFDLFLFLLHDLEDLGVLGLRRLFWLGCRCCCSWARDTVLGLLWLWTLLMGWRRPHWLHRPHLARHWRLHRLQHWLHQRLLLHRRLRRQLLPHRDQKLWPRFFHGH